MMRSTMILRGFGTKHSARQSAEFFRALLFVTARATILSIFAFTALFFFAGSEAFAQNVSNAPVIFDVRRSLPLEPDEPVFHDFYISAGPDSGFKKGMYVNVVRQVSIHDPIQNKQQGTLNIAIGRLHIIHVEKSITVGRLESENANEERPVVEFEAVMIGDKVDLASLTSESPKDKRKPKRTAKVIDPDPVVEAKAEIPTAPTQGPPPNVSVPAGASPPQQAAPAAAAPERVAPPKAETASALPPGASA